MVTRVTTRKFTYAAATHVGRVRSHNEDSGFAGPYLLIAADGVGGSAAGEVASASTTYVASALSMIMTDPDLLETLADTVSFAHHHLAQGSQADESRTGMSTTFTAVLSDGEDFALAHVGDSRAYLLREGALLRLTCDHTLVQQLIDDGLLTSEDAATHPNRNVVTRAVSERSRPEPDLTLFDLVVGDRLLLCSDGLTDMVAEARIAAMLVDDDLDDFVTSLVAAALHAGGRDNVTCVVGEVSEGPRMKPHGRFVRSAEHPVNLIDGAAVRPGVPR